MKIYLVYEHYYNGAECWDNVVEAYSDKSYAENYAVYLNDKDGYASQDSSQSYHVKEMDVK